MNLCDCSSNGYVIYQPCRYISCVSGCITNIDLMTTEKRIQNQVRVDESQYIDVLGSVTIANDYLILAAPQPNLASPTWGNPNNLRNRSDRRISHGLNYTNVPSRGDSVKSTVASNRPGGMAPGGKGVDVKHDSYARYLGKLKGQKMAFVSKSVKQPSRTAVINNKSYGFTLVNTSRCVRCAY